MLNQKSSSNIQGYLVHFPVSAPQIFSNKIFLYFFPKNTCSEKVSYVKNFLIFSQISPDFQKTEFSNIFLKKFFLYFGKGIFRTLAYSEPWYIQNSRHIQNNVKHIRWNILQKQLASALKKSSYIFLIFQERVHSSSSIKKVFLLFQKMGTPKKFMFQETKLSYISGNRNFKNLIIFLEVTFKARKMKKATLKRLVTFQENGKKFLFSRVAADFVY